MPVSRGPSSRRATKTKKIKTKVDKSPQQYVKAARATTGNKVELIKNIDASEDKWHVQDPPLKTDLEKAEHSRKRRLTMKTKLGGKKRLLTSGSFCSGIGADVLALEKHGIHMTHRFAADINPHARNAYKLIHEPEIFYGDIMENDVPTRAPKVDLFGAGFPCQPFSSAGNQLGVADKARGLIITGVLKYICKKKPTVFYLENVGNLEARHNAFLQALLHMLGNIKDAKGKPLYYVDYKVLDSAQFGIPQHRERLYIVGWRRQGALASEFTWPKPGTPTSIRTILCNEFKQQDPKMSATCKGNIDAIKQALHTHGIDWRHAPVVADIDGSKPNYAVDMSPCLTGSRGQKGFWLLDQQRRMTLPERARSMGMDFTRVSIGRAAMSENMFGQILGNSITLEPLGSVLKHLLQLAKLV